MNIQQLRLGMNWLRQNSGRTRLVRQTCWFELKVLAMVEPVIDSTMVPWTSVGSVLQLNQEFVEPESNKTSNGH